MTSNPKIFELLKDFMDAASQSERWITVQEFRTFFHLKTSCSPVIAGYFHQLYQNPKYLCLYRVIRIEHVRDPTNRYRTVRRYLVGGVTQDTRKRSSMQNPDRLLKIPCER